MQRWWVVFSVLATSAWSQVDAGVDAASPPPEPAAPTQAAPSAPAPEATPTPSPVAAPPPAAAPAPSTPPPAALTPTRAPEPEPEPARPLDLSFLSVLLPITPALSSIYYDLSAVYSHQGYGFAEGPSTFTGLRFVERNSGLGKMTVWVVTQLVMAFGEAAAGSGLVQKHLGTSYGPGYRIDYYQRYSADEVAAMRRSREATGDAMLSSNMSLDLQLYLPVPGVTKSSGISVEITPVTFEFADSGEVGMEIALAYTRLTDVMPDTLRERTYDNFGLPIRIMANWRFLNFQLQWVPNFLGGFGFDQKVVQSNYLKSLESDPMKPIFYNNSPLSFSVSAHPLRWVFVRATGSWNRFQFDVNSLGFQLEAGLRL